MTLLDSLYINDGGGKVLLDYLVEEIERKKLEVFYLFDDRCRGDYDHIPQERKLYLEASLLNRHRFYRKHRNDFSKVLCFGNLPPNIVLDVPVSTYFHMPLFIKIPETSKGIQRFKLLLKMLVINSFKNKTDVFLVQSQMIKKGLRERYKLENNKVRILPFYPPLPILLEAEREKNSFLYVSTGHGHKNHHRLLSAFCSFYDEYQKGKLILTVSRDFPDLYKKIEELQKLSYPIENLGFIRREDLANVYCRSEYLIFPSLAESFGLGLIEAIEKGCKVIGADLEYTYAICKPSLKFNPISVSSIEKAMVKAVTSDLEPSVPLIENGIKELLDFLK